MGAQIRHPTRGGPIAARSGDPRLHIQSGAKGPLGVSRTRRIKAEAEHVYCDAERIIGSAIFDAVQKALKSRNPRVTPPRTVSGPILLTGLATCATCGGGMTLRAGTSRMGEIYRYYSCSNAMKKDKTACRGRSIRMDKLDTLVTEHLADCLLEPERLAGMLTTLAARRTDKQAAVDKRIISLAREAEDAGERLRRLYKLVEDGLAQMDELLKDRIAALKAAREAAMAALDRAKSATHPIDGVSPLAVDRFARAMRERLKTGDVPFRKAYIASIVDRIEVDDTQVRIKGRKEVLEQAVRSTGATPPVVHTFVPNWRPRQDLNL